MISGKYKNGKSIYFHLSVADLHMPISVSDFFSLVSTERMQKEEEEEALPLDMMDEDDLKLMEEFAQTASFITRDLSSKWVLANPKL